jgi:hypothetical protein
MCIDTGISCSTSQILVLSVGDVLMSLGVSVFLGQTEIDHIDNMRLLAQSDQKVVRLDISVDVVLAMHIFNSGNLGLLKHFSNWVPFDQRASKPFSMRIFCCTD